jgi:hypothetical protein
MAVTGAVADTDVAVKPMARGRVALVLIALAMGLTATSVSATAPETAMRKSWGENGGVLRCNIGGPSQASTRWK